MRSIIRKDNKAMIYARRASETTHGRRSVAGLGDIYPYVLR